MRSDQRRAGKSYSMLAAILKRALRVSDSRYVYACLYAKDIPYQQDMLIGMMNTLEVEKMVKPLNGKEVRFSNGSSIQFASMAGHEDYLPGSYARVFYDHRIVEDLQIRAEKAEAKLAELAALKANQSEHEPCPLCGGVCVMQSPTGNGSHFIGCPGCGQYVLPSLDGAYFLTKELAWAAHDEKCKKLREQKEFKAKAEPQLYICPKARDGECVFPAGCPHEKKHEKQSGCGHGHSQACPACVPVEAKPKYPCTRNGGECCLGSQNCVLGGCSYSMFRLDVWRDCPNGGGAAKEE